MKFIFLLPLFFHFSQSFATIAIPEKIIEISIYDLIEQKKTGSPPPSLPPGYGDEIIRRILAKEKELMMCIPKGKAGAITIPLSISIQPSGTATTKFLDNKGNPCVSNILNAIAFPTHNLKQPVSVRIPLVLENTVL